MIVSVEELKTYSGITRLRPEQEDAGELVLLGLQGELEGYLRRPIETEQFTEDYVIQFPNDVQQTYADWWGASGVAVYTDGPLSVPFRNSPVANIISVGTYCPTSGSVTAIERGTGWVQQRYGMDLYNGTPGTIIRVSYTAGLEWDKPRAMDHFRLLILRAAAREVQPIWDENVGKQNLEGDPQLASPTGFTLAELESVSRYRRQRI